MSDDRDIESALYEDVSPMTDLVEETTRENFQPLNIPTAIDVDPEDYDGGDEIPSSWLFSTEPRRTLVEFALWQVATQDDEDVQTYNKTTLGEAAGVSRHSVVRYIDDLVDVGIYEVSGNRRPIYRPNTDSEVLPILHALNERLKSVADDPSTDENRPNTEDYSASG